MAERDWNSAKVVANLPYYISTPVIMGLLEARIPLSSITVMVQREVAERLIAKPGGKEYGALSLAAAYYADVSISAYVPPNCFFPRPNVDSAVVTMKLRSEEAEPDFEDVLFKCIKAAFGNRRKTLVNCLRTQDWITNDRQAVIDVVTECGFNENIRGEALSLEEFTSLTAKLRHSGITSFL
jgi:16S rRNA (adenine1518-N6/adenine1519-N6)-dimethyltransferase